MPGLAQKAPQTAAAPAMATAPKLLVVISVDQLSADLFAEYRNRFTGGFARLLDGAVFPAGYQSHAATVTCVGHATILTGMRPSRTGIIANDWIDFASPLDDKKIYCVEDESVPGSTHKNYTVSPDHLMVPTLGERMKTANPATRVVSVAGKDRSAVLMGGHKVDEMWWWDRDSFVTYAGRATPPVVARTNQAVAAEIARAQPALALPDYCRAKDRAIPLGANKTVGTGRFARAAGDASAFGDSPAKDGATLALAAGLIQAMQLGKGPQTDIIDIGASVSDHVGHKYGTEGTEMCLQLTSLDRDLGDFFTQLDAMGIDYAVALTADHGGNDLPERQREQAMPMAERLAASFNPDTIGKAVAATLGLSGKPLAYESGNFYVTPDVPAAKKQAVIAETKKVLLAQPQVAAVFTGAEIAASPDPAGPPDIWPLIMRAKASYYPGRSGDLIVALKPLVTPIADPTRGSVATHGSFWDYDRRVPILFWRRGMTGFEQPHAIETVDIAPTLAALAHVATGAPAMDGRCLDLDAGPGSTCP
ncbi:alkaline phosphatase family protein [Hephaestia sp. GCM10023244]|uniref:alkaline phosphatase family protein n=1 Tax=unclassified Hephaestia TaxID=2631281 RepID=UPI002076FF37|nr:alkaline phosphatase family protein [Hephaestia sp. MAHUQ-44]MCM8731743.1 alkaline phosphatase family protein [Hephaestia sp. MAHUQ-44]